MKTREKILNHALRLFNEKGISNVSSKHISEEMGISYGNLCYHFPKKDDIILELYLNMQREIDDQIAHVEQGISQMQLLLAGLKKLFEITYKYKFIYLGITKVIRHFDKIKRHAQEQNERRQKIFNDLGKLLVEAGYMIPFESKEEKDMAIHTLLIIINSWISDSEVFYKGEEQSMLDYYVKLFFNIVKPRLTPKGLQGYEEVYAYYTATIAQA